MRNILKYFILFSFFCVFCFSQIKEKDVFEKKLSNGMKVVIVKTTHNPFVGVNVTYKVGSVNDKKQHLTGLAHFIEHMSLKGTSSITFEKLYDYYLSNGGEISNKIARTGKYITSFNLSMPKNKLKFMLEFESDRMKNLNFTGFENEKNVIQNEYNINRSNIIKDLHEFSVKSAFIEDDFGNSVVGELSDIKKINRTVLRKFYEENYNPQNSVITLVGDLSFNETYNLVNKYFGSIKNTNPNKNKINITAIKFPGEIKKDCKRKRKIRAVEVSFRKSLNVNEQPVFEIIGEYLVSKFDKSKKIRRVISNYTNFTVSRIFSLIAVPSQNRFLNSIEEKMISEFDDLEITKQELEKIKVRLKTKYFRKLKSNLETAYSIGKYEGLFEEGKYFTEFPERIDKVNLNEIKKIIKKYFVEENRIVARAY